MRVRMLVVVVAVLALIGCQQGAQRVTLAELTTDTETYEGQEVITSGEVVAFDVDEGALERHIVVQDDHPNRVQLEPIGEAEPYIGAQVEVRGTFRFDPQVGRILDIDSIEER